MAKFAILERLKVIPIASYIFNVLFEFYIGDRAVCAIVVGEVSIRINNTPSRMRTARFITALHKRVGVIVRRSPSILVALGVTC